MFKILKNYFNKLNDIFNVNKKFIPYIRVLKMTLAQGIRNSDINNKGTF